MHKVGIVGFRGYSGAELVQIAKRHPHIEPVLLEHRSDSSERPEPRGGRQPERRPLADVAMACEGLSAVMLATPHDVSMTLAPAMLEAGVKVVDLSGAFRLTSAEEYTRWYKEPHKAAALLGEAVYGLPEFCREQVRGARLVANPGCYPTAANLAIAPLVEAELADLTSGVVCDAKSGVSGAGRKPAMKTSYCEVTENFSVYGAFDHRHVPEVLAISGLEEGAFTFTAQLLPLDRGILETIYLRLRPGVTTAAVLQAYERRYASEPFVRLYDPATLPDIRAVQRTNYCDIGFRIDEATGRALIVSAIDNLVKGAAGQAVQNLNLLLGFDEAEGLQ